MLWQRCAGSSQVSVLVTLTLQGVQLQDTLLTEHGNLKTKRDGHKRGLDQHQLVMCLSWWAVKVGRGLFQLLSDKQI